MNVKYKNSSTSMSVISTPTPTFVFLIFPIFVHPSAIFAIFLLITICFFSFLLLVTHLSILFRPLRIIISVATFFVIQRMILPRPCCRPIVARRLPSVPWVTTKLNYVTTVANASVEEDIAGDAIKFAAITAIMAAGTS